MEKNQKKLRYRGSWANGKRDGQGELFNRKGDRVYSGDWKQGVRHGKGVEYFTKDGTVRFEGHFRDDQRHGIGKDAKRGWCLFLLGKKVSTAAYHKFVSSDAVD